MQRIFTPQSGLVSGNVADSFQKLSNIIEKSDGVRNFSVLTNNCYGNEVPFEDQYETHICITNNVHDINQLSQSYLRMELEADVHLDKALKGASKVSIYKSTQLTPPDITTRTINPTPYTGTITYPADADIVENGLYNIETGAKFTKEDEILDLFTDDHNSVLVLKCISKKTEVEGSKHQFGTVEYYYFGCQATYGDYAHTKNHDTPTISFTTNTEKECTELLATKYLDKNYDPADEGKFYSAVDDSHITQVGDLKFLDLDVAPVWFKTSSAKYLILVHKYNSAWNPGYKTYCDTNTFEHVIEVNLQSWKYILNTSTKLPDIDKATYPAFAADTKLIKFADNSAKNDYNGEANTDYWINRDSGPYIVHIIENDKSMPSDAEIKNAGELYQVVYDKITCGTDKKVTWLYAITTADGLKDENGELVDVPAIRIFLGWKNANEIIRQLRIYNAGNDTTYLQRYSSIEGFLYSTFKPNEEKKNNLFAHTSYENARTGFRGICGGYIEIDPKATSGDYIETAAKEASPMTTKTDFTVKGLEVILPITDILCLRSFEDYPGALGDITLGLYLNKSSMVYCQCDPKITYDQNYFITHDKFVEAPDSYSQAVYTRGFTQIGQQCTMIDDYSTCTSSINRLSIRQLRCTKLTCDCYGYNVTQECKKQILNIFNSDEPFIIPSNQVDVYNFLNIIGTRNGSTIEKSTIFSDDIAMQLRNVSKICIVFPKSGSDVTTFTNPMLNKVQLRIQNKQYPQIPFANTYDSRFYTQMLRASDVGSFYEADKEYINSLITPRKQNDNTYTDLTSFILTFQTERSSDNVFFDGIETGMENVNIQLDFQPTDNTNPAHYNHAPQLWLLRETYWTADVQNGLKYWAKNTPEVIYED